MLVMTITMGGCREDAGRHHLIARLRTSPAHQGAVAIRATQPNPSLYQHNAPQYHGWHRAGLNKGSWKDYVSQERSSLHHCHALIKIHRSSITE